jgi:hypothetical protein
VQKTIFIICLLVALSSPRFRAGDSAALDYKLTLQELQLMREREAQDNLDIRASASWNTTGLESYCRGPWLTDFPGQPVIGRVNGRIKTILKNKNIRDVRLIDELLCMMWALRSERSDYYRNPDLAAVISEKISHLNEMLSSWSITGKKVKHKISRATSTAAVWALCNELRQNKDKFKSFPAGEVDKLEKSVRISAITMCQPTPAGSLWVWQTRQPWRVARLMMTHLVAYKITGKDSYLESISDCLTFLEQDICSLGGFRYSSIDPLPNVQTYMDQTLLEMGNFYLHAVDEKTLKFRKRLKGIFEKMKDNYIYRALPVGTYDYSAVPNGMGVCKTLWATPPFAYGPMVLAMATGDGVNATISRYMAYYFMGYPGEMFHSFYLTLKFAEEMKEIEPAPLPDKYILYDRSIAGIRTLDSNLSCVFNLVPGAGTVVGARTAVKPERRYLGWRGSYGSILQAVFPEVGRTPWKYSEKGPYNRRSSMRNPGWYDTDGDKVRSSEWAAFTASYKLKGAKNSKADKAYSWQVRQVWFYLEKHLFGLVVNESLAKQQAPYVAQLIQFNRLGKLIETDSGEYSAGDFSVRLIEHNYPLVEKGLCDGYSAEKPVSGFTGKEIRLADNPTDNKTPAQYEKGNRFFVILDIAEKHAAEKVFQVEEFTEAGCIGLKIKSKTKNYIILYRINPDVGKIKLQQFDVPLTAWAYSGEKQRQQWFDRRRPSHDREKPEDFYYQLPEHGAMVLCWESK